jgi:hypothetical protein
MAQKDADEEIRKQEEETTGRRYEYQNSYSDFLPLPNSCYLFLVSCSFFPSFLIGENQRHRRFLLPSFLVHRIVVVKKKHFESLRLEVPYQMLCGYCSNVSYS